MYRDRVERDNTHTHTHTHTHTQRRLERDETSENVGAKASSSSSSSSSFFILLRAVTGKSPRFLVRRRAASSLPSRPDEGENDFADSSARFSYSWYNNDDNDNNNGNDYVSETAGSLTNALRVGTGSLAYRPD